MAGPARYPAARLFHSLPANLNALRRHKEYRACDGEGGCEALRLRVFPGHRRQQRTARPALQLLDDPSIPQEHLC